MKERWKDIIGFEKKYQISSLGRVKSLNHYVKHSQGGLKIIREKILTPIITKNGYSMIEIGRGNKFLIHRLIGLTFLSNPENKRCINHLDGNKLNNRLKNLKWCSYSENERWSYDKLGKQVWNKGTKGLMPIPWNKGKKYPQFSGKNHWNWQGGFKKKCIDCRIIIKDYNKSTKRCRRCHYKHLSLLYKRNTTRVSV